MTKKHFEALAAALKDASFMIPVGNRTADSQHIYDAKAVAGVCARFNPNFDRARFLAACGVEG